MVMVAWGGGGGGCTGRRLWAENAPRGLQLPVCCFGISAKLCHLCAGSRNEIYCIVRPLVSYLRFPRGLVDQKKFLDTELKTFTTAELKLKIGPTSSEHKFDVAVMARARHGFYSFWSLTDLYRTLHFEMYNRVASRWAWGILPSCEKFIGRCCDDQVIRNMPYSSSETECEGGQDRILPWHSISSLALIALLSRWSAAGARSGGLVAVQARRACSSMLEGLCDSVLKGATKVIFIYFGGDFEWRWPRPPTGSCEARMVVEDRRPAIIIAELATAFALTIAGEMWSLIRCLVQVLWAEIGRLALFRTSPGSFR